MIHNFLGFCNAFQDDFNVVEVDTEYILRAQELKNGKHTWIGTRNMIIYYRNTSSSWVLCNQFSDDCYANYKTNHNIPVGRHSWKLTSQYNCKHQQERKHFDVLLSSCKDDEFTCNDGTCIDIEKKCDLVNNCLDDSDEEFCNILSTNYFKKSYENWMPDIKISEDDNILASPINISIGLLGITKIKEMQMSCAIKFNLSLTWLDSRLRWMNLLNNTWFNILNTTEISKIWIPNLVFKNTADELKTIADNNSIILVKKHGSHRKENLDFFETAYFEGSENPIIFSKNYNQDFICNFDLHKYPFDIQTCLIVIGTTDKDKFFMELFPENLEYFGQKDMLTYTVKEYKMKKSDGYVSVEVTLKRLGKDSRIQK